MPLVNPYCTVAQVREELRNTDTDLETAILDAINAASRYIDDYKGRDYFFHDHSNGSANGTLVLRGGMENGLFSRHFLILPYRPVRAIASVTVNGALWAEDVDYISDVYRLISINGVWPVKTPSHTVAIVGTFGYTQANEAQVPAGLPSNIIRAAVLIAAAFTGHLQREIVGLDGGKTSLIDKSIPKSAFDCLGGRKVVI